MPYSLDSCTRLSRARSVAPRRHSASFLTPSTAGETRKTLNIGSCCRANTAHIRQSSPDSDFGLSHFQTKVTFQDLPFSLGSGTPITAGERLLEPLPQPTTESPPPSDGRLNRCRANMVHLRRSRPDSGLGLKSKGIGTFKSLPLRSEAGLYHDGNQPGKDWYTNPEMNQQPQNCKKKQRFKVAEKFRAVVRNSTEGF